MYFDPERLRHTGGRTNCCVGVNRTTSPNFKPVTYLHSIAFVRPNNNTYFHIHSNSSVNAARFFSHFVWEKI